MSVASSIKKAIQKVGTSYTILRNGVSVGTEYALIKINAQVTKPFIREFFLEAMLPADSATNEGDVFALSDGRRFLLMNRTPEGFKGAIYSFSCVLYKCNIVSGQILRPSKSDVGYDSSLAWTSIATGISALQTESFYGNMLDPEIEIGLIGREMHDLYIPRSYGIQEHDRWKLSATEYYEVTEIKSRRFAGVDLAQISKDTR